MRALRILAPLMEFIYNLTSIALHMRTKKGGEAPRQLFAADLCDLTTVISSARFADPMRKPELVAL